MKLYLSSFKLGNEVEKLKELISHTKGQVGYIPNALDFSHADPTRRKEHIEDDLSSLLEIGLTVEVLDLREFFGRAEDLRRRLPPWVECG
ncbi:MAG: hypothetical protein Q7R81_00215 [Candidatus Peregrinibacteria bacterium]|nr:hypothetical protein [Candidatus Peregrinibacteria bacterium]